MRDEMKFLFPREFQMIKKCKCKQHHVTINNCLVDKFQYKVQFKYVKNNMWCKKFTFLLDYKWPIRIFCGITCPVQFRMLATLFHLLNKWQGSMDRGYFRACWGLNPCNLSLMIISSLQEPQHCDQHPCGKYCY